MFEVKVNGGSLWARASTTWAKTAAATQNEKNKNSLCSCSLRMNLDVVLNEKLHMNQQFSATVEKSCITQDVKQNYGLQNT